MEPVFQPSILPHLEFLPHINIQNFQTALAGFLEAKKGEYPDIFTEFADPSSLIYDHLQKTFAFIVPHPPNLPETEHRRYFHMHVIHPAVTFLRLGERAMAKDLGAHFLGGQKSPMDSTKPDPPIPPKTAEPAKPVVPPPRHTPTSSFGGGAKAPSPVFDSSENKLYMSRLPEGVAGDGDKLRKILSTLKFPRHLAQAPFSVRQIKKEGVQACILVGDPDNPRWADEMVASKPQSSIRYTAIHMAKAYSKKVQSSPDRPKKVEELEAQFRRISLGGASSPPQDSPSPMQRSPPDSSSRSPMQRSPAVSFDSPPSASMPSGGGGGRNNKRGWEKPQRLVFNGRGEVDIQLSSPSPDQNSSRPMSARPRHP